MVEISVIMRRDYRLSASPGDALAALRAQVARAQIARLDRRDEDALDITVEGDRFTLFLGRNGASEPAAALRGVLDAHGALTNITTQTSLVSLHPDTRRASLRELAEWAVIIIGLAVAGVAFGLRTGTEAMATVLRWSLLFAAIVSARVGRRVLRRRHDQADLMSIVEGAFGPLQALPEAGPFRETGLPEPSDSEPRA